MRQRIIRLFAVLLMCCVSPFVSAKTQPDLAVTIDVHHVAKDTWRVDYRFARPVTAFTFYSIGELRQKSWKVLTPGMRMKFESDRDILDVGGKPFRSASIEIRTFDDLEPKSYAPFNRFSDGGTAFFLGFLQGKGYQGTRELPVLTDFRLHGLAQENVLAPPPNQRHARRRSRLRVFRTCPHRALGFDAIPDRSGRPGMDARNLAGRRGEGVRLL